MTDLAVLIVAGGVAWEESAFHEAHAWWEVAWLRTPPGPLREGLRALTQWAAAAHVESLGRFAAAERIRDRASQRFRRTTNRLALAPFALDLPSDAADQQALRLRPSQAALPLTAVLLAAGHGRRAGGPKALIAVDGQPLWQQQAQRLLAAGAARVVAVLHPDSALVTLPRLDALHGDPDATPLHSLQRALAVTTGPVLLLPVDCPAPERGLVLRLVAAAIRAGDAQAVRPVVATAAGVRGGHPLWLAAATVQALRQLDPATARLDTFLHGLGAGYVSLPVADARVLGNFNLDGVAR